jgi:hypothetical protein
VTSVSLTNEDKPGDNVIRRRKRWNLSVGGFVESPAATRIELLGPGKLLKSAKLPSTSDGRWRSFNFSTSASPYGQFIIRVRDNEGAFFEKRYHFIKVGHRYRNRKSGEFLIPFVNVSEKDRPIDRALDRIFSVGRPRSGGAPGSIYDPSILGQVPLFDEEGPPNTVPF